jgi:hypothetical protein
VKRFGRVFACCAVAAAAIGFASIADAQGRGQGAQGGRGGGGGGGGFGRGGGAYTPEPGARDLKAVLFNWTWHMGMLRGEAEPELIGTLEYRAVGTVQVNGQACTLAPYVPAEPGVLGHAGYRVSANYQSEGYRTRIECTLPNGRSYVNVEALSGDYVWDEDIPGAELVPGEGKATPNKAARDERLIRLWASPHGAPKAAIAAAAGLPIAESYAQNPATLLDRQSAAGVTSGTTLTWEGNQPILTFPIPGVQGAVATATLSADFLPERVVVRHGGNTTEFVYGGFGDFNNPLAKIEALYAGTIVERFNGRVVRDLQTVVTEIGQVYVVVPVPASVRAAGPAN